jgi:GNAT superfamily N-acetyltransferase
MTLIPEVHADKHGKLVTRHVRQASVTESNKLLGVTAVRKAAPQATPEEAFEGSLTAIRDEYPDAHISLQVSTRGFSVLSKIEIPKGERNAGHGTKIMQSIVDAADEQGISLALTPSNEFGSSKARLEQFYKRFGFVANKGRNKDFTTRETMIRPVE